MKHLTHHSPYTPQESYNITWLRQSIMNLLMNYQSNFFSKNGNTESDILFRVWSCVQYAFDKSKIDVNSGEKESKATSCNNNSNRSLGKRKMHGTRVDLRFMYDGSELGCAEAGRVDEGELGTKEMSESQLKCPKTLRDMFVQLLKKYPDKQDELLTFGFIMMGFSVSVIVMDSPGGSICRITRSPRYSITSDIEAFTYRVLPILKFFLSVKKTMERVIKATITSHVPTPSLGESNNPSIPYSISSTQSSTASSKAASSSKASSSSEETSPSKNPSNSKPLKKQRTAPPSNSTSS
ncbi:hypothetical protein BDC45DRAFT_438165 [Circinella umbellata]|nr:hypothetical protein BDC45DRAFT_438165 [Circinella umbellata]